MNCKQIEESLSAYLDNALTAEEAEEIRTHLADCFACQKAYDDLRETVTMLSSLEEEIPPAGFRRELYTKLQKEQAVQGKGSLFQRILERMRKLNRFQLMPVAAVILIMLVSLPLMKDATRLGMTKSSKAEITVENQRSRAGGATANNVGIAEDAIMPSEAPDMTFSLKQKEMASMAQAPLLDGAKPVPAPTDPGTLAEGSEIERKIIKNADLALGVEEYDIAVNDIKNKVAAAGGYVVNESGSSNANEAIRNGFMQVRIPAPQFEAFITEMETLGKVRARNIYVQDVTEEYVDVASRLKAMQTKEERLLAILSSSGKLSDILAVENELANTRAQLESLQGRLRYLNNRTEFSNIGINIEQLTVSVQQISTGGLTGVLIKAKEAFILAVNNIIKDAGKLVIRISSALPYIFIVLVVGYGLWLIVRKKWRA